MNRARIAGVVAVASALVLVGCSSTPSAPIVTVTAPTPVVTPSPTSTATSTPTITPPPPDHFYTLDETWTLSPETEAQGSGCAPGPGSLPDGIWFGQVTTWSPTSISFDMICWWSGSGALAQAAAHGDEVNNGYYTTNDSATIRTVTLAPGAFGLKADVSLTSTGTWTQYPPAAVIADPGGSLPVGNPPLVWLAVNDGMVTSFAVQYVP